MKNSRKKEKWSSPKMYQNPVKPMKRSSQNKIRINAYCVMKGVKATTLWFIWAS